MKKIEDIPGVTIIKKEEIVHNELTTKGRKAIYVWMGFAFGLMTLGIFLGALTYPQQADSSVGILGLIIFCFGIVWLVPCGLIALYIANKHGFFEETINTGRCRYLAILDDTVTFANLDDYVVTKNDDETYTLEEKK